MIWYKTNYKIMCVLLIKTEYSYFYNNVILKKNMYIFWKLRTFAYNTSNIYILESGLLLVMQYFK